jgi:hypothetical protein
MDIVFDAVGVKEERDEAFDLLKQHTGHLVTTQPMDPAERISYLNVIGAAVDYVWKKTESVFWRDVVRDNTLISFRSHYLTQLVLI